MVGRFCGMMLMLLVALVFQHACSALKTSTADIQVLEDLFDSTNGPNWNLTAIGCVVRDYSEFYEDYGIYMSNLTGTPWDFTRSGGAYVNDPCEDSSSSSGSWTGLSCVCGTLTCSVKQLSLTCAQLTGPIPASLGNLTTLTSLDLDTNSLNGIIPPSLCNLRDLYYFDVDSNQLRGQIPSCISTLTKLKVLAIWGNIDIVGALNPDYSNLTSLEVLQLNNNQLTGTLPESFSKLTKLTTLDLGINDFTGAIPASYRSLSQLNAFYAQNNRLTGQIPDFFGNMLKLSELKLNDNQFSGSIPSSLGSAISMRLLNLARNNLNGVVPQQLSNLRNLSALQIGNNYFTSDPSAATFGQFPFIDPTIQKDLHALDIGSNSFSGPIDGRVFQLPALRSLDMSTNCFSGEVPQGVCLASKIETLIMSDLSGAECHREYFWKNTLLHRYRGYLIHEKMTGLIPSCIFENLTSLHTVVLAGNRLRGNLPLFISKNINFLDVSHNYYNHELPDNIVSENLTHLDISYNNFNGTLDIYNGKKVAEGASIQMLVNRLSGEFPAELKYVKDISALSGNVFGCSSNRSSLPVYDDKSNEYQCGSNAYWDYIYLFIAVLCALIVVRLYQYYNNWIGNVEMNEWLSVFNDNKKSGSEIAKQYPHLIHYGQEMVRLREFVKRVGLVIAVVFSIVYNLFGDEYRTVNFVYGWITTTAYMIGSAPTITLSVFWIALLFYIRYESIKHSSKVKVVREQTTQNFDDIKHFIFIPMMRLFAIVSITMVLSMGSNTLYLFIKLEYSAFAQFIATVALAVFNFLFDLFIMKGLFTSSWLYFGVDRDVHLKFIVRIVGSEMYLFFIIQALSCFWIPLITASFLEESCLKTLFIPTSTVKTQYDVYECTGFFTNGVCGDYGDVPFSVTIESPFIYNYGCSSVLFRAYTPVLISQYVIVLCNSVFQFYYLLWYTSNQNFIEKDQTYSGILYRLPQLLFIDGRLLYRIEDREVEHIQQLSDSKVYNKYRGFTTRVVKSEWTTFTFLFADHMSTLLILFTFGVFAPILAIIIILATYSRSFVSQLVLGRRICIDTSLAAIYKSRVLGETYTVVIGEGTNVRVSPDFLSQKLYHLARGDDCEVDITIAEKVGDSHLVFVKLVGKKGWIPRNSIKKRDTRKSLAADCGINVNDKTAVAHTRAQQSKTHSDFNLRHLGTLMTYRVTHLDGTYIHTEPTSQSSKIKPLKSGTSIDLDFTVDPQKDGNVTFARVYNSPGWVAMNALEPVKGAKFNNTAAQFEDYPVRLPLWLEGQTVEGMENLIRNADSPWGSVHFLNELEVETKNFPLSFIHLGLRSFLCGFALTAAIVLNDTYNGQVDKENSYWAPILILSVVPCVEIATFAWKYIYENDEDSDVKSESESAVIEFTSISGSTATPSNTNTEDEDEMTLNPINRRGNNGHETYFHGGPSWFRV